MPNFTALPVPEFSLLWHEKVDRRYPMQNGKKATSPDYILIEIEVTWLSTDRQAHTFGVSLRYNSPQSVYAIPAQGWSTFREAEKDPSFPRIAFVPALFRS